MRTDIETGLTLYEWCRFMGVDPFTMAQFGVGFPSTAPVCDKPFFTHQWQQDYLSRDEVAYAIQSAERKIADVLLYWPYPRYFRNEVQQYPQGAVQDWRGGGANVRQEWKSVSLNYGRIISGGILDRTLILAAQTVTLFDTDADSIMDMFEMSVVVPDGTSAEEIGVYIQASDRIGIHVEDGERWRIRPVHVEVSSTTATIRGHSSLIVKPALCEGYNAEVLDVKNVTNFLDKLDVYRVFTNNAASESMMYQGSAIWENPTATALDAKVSYFPISLGARDATNGMVSVDWSQSTCKYRYDPDRVSVNYVAGVPLVDGMLNTTYGEIVAKLATALLPDNSCGCARSQRIIEFWRQPIFENEGEQTPAFAPDDAGSNKFSVARGAVEAWRACMELGEVWGTHI